MLKIISGKPIMRKNALKKLTPSTYSMLTISFIIKISLLIFPQTTAWSQESSKVSYTAERNAAMRAIAAMDPDKNIRNADHLAFKFVSQEFWEKTPYSPDFKTSKRLIEKYSIGSYYYVNARTKHIDALLTAAAHQEIKQVVILGAGYDSRPYRFKDISEHVKFFEVDLLATQNEKKARVKKILGSIPAGVVYVPIDFNSQTLESVLTKTGYDRTKKSFFIWEGVTMYLDPQGIDSTLRFIAHYSAPGSSVVFDYVLQSVIEMTIDDFMCKRVVAKLAKRGEPWIYGIKEGQAETFVSERGLLLLSDVGPDQLESKYLIRSDGTIDGPMFRCARILHAVVPGSPFK